MRMPTNPEQTARPEQCTSCGTVLVDDQRYCLQCGARHGKPRLDFTAFWKPLSPTDSTDHRPNTSRTPSRGLTATLATGVLAVGILAGVALGPGPASSPADSATLAQRALAALVASAGSGSQTTTPTSTAATPPPITSEPTPAPSVTNSTKGKAKSAPAPSETGSSSESSSEDPPRAVPRKAPPNPRKAQAKAKKRRRGRRSNCLRSSTCG